jgi:hypothetical protein
VASEGAGHGGVLAAPTATVAGGLFRLGVSVGDAARLPACFVAVTITITTTAAMTATPAAIHHQAPLRPPDWARATTARASRLDDFAELRFRAAMGNLHS